MKLSTVLFIFAFHAVSFASDRPNILFISIDDLNDWIEPLNGHENTITPNLQRLADEGTSFARAYCSAPACNPSRTSLMTGVHPTNSGVYANADIWRKSPVLANIQTIPQYFRQHGYSVKGAGKIFHTLYPDPQSWDTFYPALQVQRPIEPMPPEDKMPLNNIPELGHFDWGELDVSREEMADWKVVEWVADRLSEPSDKPLFLACGIYRPHLPWYLPRGYMDKIDISKVKLPPILENDLEDVPESAIVAPRVKDDDIITAIPGKHIEAVHAYLASIHFADECLGHVLDALESGPHADNTIIVLWSDHGWQFGEKRHWRKFTLWERAAKNPLIFAGPNLPKGQTALASVSLLDIYPTLVELAGLPTNPKNDGESLVKYIENPDLHADKPTLTTLSQHAHSLRDERFRYTRYEDGTEELYDHYNDPYEWKNLFDNPAFAEHKERLISMLPQDPVDRIKDQYVELPFFQRQQRIENLLKEAQEK